MLKKIKNKLILKKFGNKIFLDEKSKKNSEKSLRIKIVSSLIVFIILIWFINKCDLTNNGIYADQSTHLLQSLSIANDFDIKYEEKDLLRFYDDGWKTTPAGLFLIKQENNYFYAKPFLYSFFSSPLTRIFNSKGPLLFNAICVSFLFLIISISINKKVNIYINLSITFLMLFSSTIFQYVEAIHPDIFIGTILATAFFLLTRENKNILLKIIASVLYGLSVYEKLPFILFFPIFLILIYDNKQKIKNILFIFIFSLSFFIPTIVGILVTKQPSAYKGNRWYFSIPPYEEKEERGYEVETNNYFEISYLITKIKPALYNLKLNVPYFFLGKQTGLLIYFPLILLIPIVIKKKQNNKNLIIGTICLLSYIVFYFIILTNNYYGGSDSLGNRYFLQVYPFLLIFLLKFEVKKNVSKLLSILIVLYSVIVYINFYNDPNFVVRKRNDFITSNKIVRLFPTETTFLPIVSRGYIESKNSKIYIVNQHGIENKNMFWIPGDNCSELFIIQDKEVGDNIYITMDLISAGYENIVYVNNESIKINNKDIKNIKYKISASTNLFISEKFVKVFKTRLCAKDGYYFPNDKRFLGVLVKNIEINY